MKKLITILLLTAGVSVYSQENANQTNSFNITIDRENPCREFMMEVFPDKGNCSAQILNVYAWGVKENEPINWRLLDDKKVERASGTFTATQTRNVNRRIELPNLPSGNYTFVATSTSCPKSPKEYSLHLQGLLQMSLLEKQDIGCNNKSSDKGSVLLRVSGGEKGSYIYGYEKIEEGHKPCGDSFDIHKPDYADDNIDGAPTYDGVPCWQKGTTNGNTFISLDEGIWRIYAMDPVRGCVVSDTVTIRHYPILSITSIVAQLCQVQTDGTIPVHITLAQRGQGKHYYQLNGQAEQSIQFTEGNTFVLNVLPDSYKITIRDEKGCYAYGGFEVKVPTPIQLNVRAAKATCATEKGQLTLSIVSKEATATKEGFSYHITGNTVVTGTTANDSITLSLPTGAYQIEVTVAETGCKLYGKVIMPEPPAALKLATTVQASANCEDAKGAAIVQVSGGVSPYTITLTHKRTGAVYSETNVGVGANAITLNFSDLKSGYYYAHVQDTAGCEAMGSVTIEEYTPIVLSKLNAETIAPSCGDANDGKLIFEVQVSGGVPPYKYKLEKKTEKTSEHTLITVTNGRGYIENLSSGSYQLLVEDSKNCIATITETTIIAPKPITVDIKVNKSHSQACDDSQNGSVTLSNIAGGSGFYRIYLINHEKKTVVDRKIGVKAGETVTFGNLASSYNIHYEIAIQDSKGCLLAHLAPFTIDEEPDVAVQSVENEINCDPTSNKGYVHTLVVKFSNNVVDYDKISYNLNNGTERSFTRTAGNIAFIDDFDAETLTQTLTVNYKPMGVGRPICPASIVNFSLTRFPQFTLERVPNDDLNVIEVIAKGGVTDPLSGYTYYFNGENQGNNPVYTIKNTDPERIEAGGVRIKTIEVKAKDAKDCIRTLVVEVPYIDIDIPNYFTPNGDGDNDRWRPKKMEDFPNAFVHVFDRNGRRMATLKPGESWDGIYAGKPMPSGDYWYTIDLNDELRDGRKIYGHFSLYR